MQFFSDLTAYPHLQMMFVVLEIISWVWQEEQGQFSEVGIEEWRLNQDLDVLELCYGATLEPTYARNYCYISHNSPYLFMPGEVYYLWPKSSYLIQ